MKKTQPRDLPSYFYAERNKKIRRAARGLRSGQEFGHFQQAATVVTQRTIHLAHQISSCCQAVYKDFGTTLVSTKEQQIERFRDSSFVGEWGFLTAALYLADAKVNSRTQKEVESMFLDALEKGHTDYTTFVGEYLGAASPRMRLLALRQKYYNPMART